MGLNVFYRFCEETPGAKPRPPTFCKRKCLENFLECFPTSNVFLVADGVTDETYKWLLTKVPRVERTEFKNGGKVFTHVIRRAMKELRPQDFVYFVEDDYIHLPGSEDVLMEGLEFGDYVTLYDCPDKYVNHVAQSQFDGTQVLIEARWGGWPDSTRAQDVRALEGNVLDDPDVCDPGREPHKGLRDDVSVEFSVG